MKVRIPLKVFFLWKPSLAKEIELAKRLVASVETQLGQDSSVAIEQVGQLREAVKAAEGHSQEITARLVKVSTAAVALKYVN
jgi:hypothetical protein